MPRPKGFKHTEESKHKMSESAKGNTNGFKRGQIPWNKSRNLSDAHKENLSEAHTGNKHSEETKQKMSEAKRGIPLSEDHKRSISEGRQGIIFSEETKQKMSETVRRTVKRGKDSHSWRGGITPEHRLIRNSPEMEDWRKFVFERDDYQCQECLKWGGELRAHHCKSFADYPHLRFQTWNGLTLCKDCHQRYHGGIG